MKATERITHFSKTTRKAGNEETLRGPSCFPAFLMKNFSPARLASLLALAVVFAFGDARGADEKLDLDSVLNDKDKVIKAEEAEAGPGDGKFFTIKTDDNITTLEVGDVYRNEQKTFFKVTGIQSKGTQGGEFSVQRTAGKSEPDRKFQRVSGAGPVTIVARITLLDLYVMGGFFMHPIALMGMLMILLALNCAWIYRRNAQIPPRFVEDARKALEAGDVGKFEDLALKERGLFPGICRALADRFDSSTPEEIKSRAEIAAGGLIGKLRVPTKALNLIAAAAPLLGLLGTIVGMVIVFEAVASATGAAKAQALAAGIRVKLFCTAAALSVAIPSLFLYFIFNQKLSDLISQCESLTELFLHQLMQLKRKSANAGGDARPAKTAAAKPAGKSAEAKEDE
jgi:biopolymer transport protein ExbB